jgi:transposase
MMGRQEDGQGQFFYSFNLDKVVPADHLAQQIDGLLDLGWVHRELAPYYSHTGRPSIDPVLMIRMLLVGYVFAIRSERRICAEIQVNRLMVTRCIALAWRFSHFAAELLAFLPRFQHN